MAISPEVLTTIFWYSAIVGTIIFILKIALPLDGGSEVISDFTSMTDTDASFSVFTIEAISAFFMSSGWMGWVSFTKMHHEMKISIIVAVVSGFVAMFLFTWLINQLRKLDGGAKDDINELVDRNGKAYMQFAPKGAGKIQIELNSKLQIVDAINETDEEIKTFEIIKVTKIQDNKVYVKRDNQ